METECSLQGSVTNFDLSETLRLCSINSRWYQAWNCCECVGKRGQGSERLEDREEAVWEGENRAFWIRTRFKILHLSCLYKKSVEEENKFCAKSSGDVAVVKPDIILLPQLLQRAWMFCDMSFYMMSFYISHNSPSC